MVHLKQFLSNQYLNFGDKLPSRSTTFVIIKYLVFAFVCLILTASVVLVPFAPKLIADLEPHATPEQLAAYRTELLFGLVIIIIFFSIGAYGVYKEHFCMATAFAIFMLFLLVGSVADDFNGIVIISIFSVLTITFCAMVKKNGGPVSGQISAA